MAQSKRLLDSIYLEHTDAVTAFVRRRYANEDAVADIVQEAFLRLLQYPNPEAIREPKAFLFQTAANVAIDYLRRDKTRRFADYDADIDKLEIPYASPEQQCEYDERLQLFSAWLQDLPELQRHAFVLFRIEGYSHKDIAEKLGISVRCSERYVQQTLRYLVSCLDAVDTE
jgi:RNA polymerase sigma factor (sigma-70 family)